MDKSLKQEMVSQLNEKFSKAKAAVLADFSGMTVQEMEKLRAGFRKASVDYHVVKNTLVNRASKGTHFEALSKKIVGPLSIAISNDDVVAPAKIVFDFNEKNNYKLKVICGIIEGKEVTPDDINKIANLPSKEVLISKMLSTMQAPVRGFVVTLNGVSKNFVCVLTAIKDKKEKSKI